MSANASSVKSMASRVSKQDAWAISKPWVEMAARTAGVKSLYDVPEYFRERFELRGASIGGKKLGGGLAGATNDLLEKNQRARAGEGKDPRAVRDAIDRVNKKLALTKEGSVKGSDARNKMAQILKEQRAAKRANKDKVGSDVKNLLDDYTTQKVDGMTATREALRTGLTVTGTRNLMGLGNAAINSAQFIQDAKQQARREGKDFNKSYLAKQFASSAKDKWSTLTNKNKSFSDKLGAVSSLTSGAETMGFSDTGDVRQATAAAQTMNQLADKKDPRNWGKVSGAEKKDSTRKIVTQGRQTVDVPAKNRMAANDPRHRQTIDEKFSQDASKRGVQPQGLGSKDKKAQPAAPKQKANRNTTNTKRRYGRRNKAFVGPPTKTMFYRRIATRLNITVGSICGALWIGLQIPFALLSLMFLGFAGFLDAAKDFSFEVTDETPWYAAATKRVANFLLDVTRELLDLTVGGIAYILDKFSIDLSILHPETIFTMMWFVLMGFALIQFLIIALIYKLFRLEPVMGEGASFKIGAIIMYFVGYGMPILNLLPWFSVWLFAIWLKPK